MEPKSNYRINRYGSFACFAMILSFSSLAQGDSLAFGDTKTIQEGLAGKVYAIPKNISALPRFDTLEPIATIYTNKIDIPAREWTTGFPGVPDRKEWFGIVYKGNFTAAKKGKYTFRLLSDDGARLYINKKLVVDNDGLHYPQSKLGDIELDAKTHSIKLEYFQGQAPHIALQLFVTYDKDSEELFPGSQFKLSSLPKKMAWKSYLIYAGLALLLFLFLWFWLRRKRNIPAD